MLRYRLAGPALAAHLMWRRIVPNGAGFRVIVLHGIAESDWSAFEWLVDYVQREHGFLTPAEAEAWLGGQAPPAAAGGSRRMPCMLTFDDGFKSNFAIGRDVLAPRGIEAVFFVCPGLLELPAADQKAAVAGGVFDGGIGPGDLGADYDLMSWAEVMELREAGHVIGSHGMTHRHLSGLSGDELRREVLDAADILASRLGTETSWYAYAFGDIDSISADALKVIAKRYPLCRSGVRGLNTDATHRLAVSADAIDLAAPAVYQRFVVEGGLDSLYSNTRQRLRRAAESRRPTVK